MKDDRYQNQNFFVKVYRWFKYKPVYLVKAGFCILKTFFNRNLLWDEDEKVYFRRDFIFGLICSESDAKMKHYYLLEEIKC